MEIGKLKEIKAGKRTTNGQNEAWKSVFSAHDGMVKNIQTKSERTWDRERDLIWNNKHCVQNECDLGGRGIRNRIQTRTST